MNINNFKIPKAELAQWAEIREGEKPKYQNKRTQKINKSNQKLFDNSERLEALYREYADKYEATIIEYMVKMHKATLEQDLDTFKVLAKEVQSYIWQDCNDYFDRLARYIQPRIKSLSVDKPYRNTLGILKRNLHKLIWVEKNLHLYFDSVPSPRKRTNLNYFW